MSFLKTTILHVFILCFFFAPFAIAQQGGLDGEIRIIEDQGELWTCTRVDPNGGCRDPGGCIPASDTKFVNFHSKQGLPEYQGSRGWEMPEMIFDNLEAGDRISFSNIQGAIDFSTARSNDVVQCNGEGIPHWWGKVLRPSVAFYAKNNPGRGDKPIATFKIKDLQREIAVPAGAVSLFGHVDDFPGYYVDNTGSCSFEATLIYGN